MKAHQFIKDYNIVDEEGKDMFLNVIGQSGDLEYGQPNPEHIDQDDLIKEDLDEDDLSK